MALQPTVALRQVGKGVFCAKYKKAVFLTLFYNCALQSDMGIPQRSKNALRFYLRPLRLLRRCLQPLDDLHLKLR